MIQNARVTAPKVMPSTTNLLRIRRRHARLSRLYSARADLPARRDSRRRSSHDTKPGMNWLSTSRGR
jgi:hypothetical protein